MDKNTISLILSCIAIILSGIAAFSLQLDLNSSSFALGILTLLVTLLVAWQIYNKIDIERQIKKNIENKIRIASDTSLFVAFAQLGRSAFNKEEKEDSIQSLLNALCIWDDDMKTDIALEAFNYVNNTLLTLIENIDFEVENVDEKDTYIKALHKTNNRLLIDFGYSIKVRKTKNQIEGNAGID